MKKSNKNLKPLPTTFEEKRERLYWLRSQPAARCLDISFAYVNPLTGAVEDDESLNTQFEVWVESGPIEEHYGVPCSTHDYQLDCGAPDLETALLVLASLIEYCYDGSTRRTGSAECDVCVERDADGYCLMCGWFRCP